jgi:hypothetical protein
MKREKYGSGIYDCVHRPSSRADVRRSIIKNSGRGDLRDGSPVRQLNSVLVKRSLQGTLFQCH